MHRVMLADCERLQVTDNIQTDFVFNTQTGECPPSSPGVGGGSVQVSRAGGRSEEGMGVGSDVKYIR